MDVDEDADENGTDEARRTLSQQTGPYFLQPALQQIQLATEEDATEAEITCVEYWGGNLYIGTSQAEVLHYVLFSADDPDESAQPDFMLASKTQLQPASAGAGEPGQTGVQQILLLTRANKACILCNGTLTFYSLPELSPAYASTPVRNCNWVGGADLNQEGNDNPSEGEIVMLSRKNRISLVRLGNDPRPVVLRNIEYPRSLNFIRRGSFACVANSTSYDLLDVDHQQKIPLFPISSIQDSSEASSTEEPRDVRSAEAAQALVGRTSSPAKGQTRAGSNQGHGRSTSLSALVAGFAQRGQSPRPQSSDSLDHTQAAAAEEFLQPPAHRGAMGASDVDKRQSRKDSHDKPLPSTPGDPVGKSTASLPRASVRSVFLRPHVSSPTPTEFLLTTGTTEEDPGVGIFVNLDGDVCRGTIQFTRYPEEVVVDTQNLTLAGRGDISSPDYVLAVIKGSQEKGEQTTLEVQALNAGAEGDQESTIPLSLPCATGRPGTSATDNGPAQVGIRKVRGAVNMSLDKLSTMLQLVRLRPPGHAVDHPQAPAASGSPSGDPGRPSEETKDASRTEEEERFARRFSRQQCQLVMWSGNSFWWIVRNPLAIRLDAQLGMATSMSSEWGSAIDRRKIVNVLNSIRGQEPTTEAHFVSLGYIRQKASLMMFTSLIYAASNGNTSTGEEMHLAEESLLEGMIDPRVIMVMIAFLHQDVVEGERGIWVHGGLQAYLQPYLTKGGYPSQRDTESLEPNMNLLRLLRTYLSGWRRKKGFGSISDEKHIFESVDAGLLHVLLELDKSRTMKAMDDSTARAELYAVADQGVDCFDRAIELLEQYQRLYVLSRLYHNRKLSAKVLSTWKRILEGEVDTGEDFVDGENEMRKYLAKIRDPAVVAQYGAWLAQRNPALGVQVFTTDNSRVRLEPEKVIDLLKSRAPDALKQYLEHLVFGRKDSRYANELITFYLDSVLSVLESSREARSILARSYETYRALRPPRPTYREFITENAIDEGWWSDRLRLLELLGGSHGAAAAYDVPRALARVEPFEKELVPEMIILHGKQARHQSALRLLTHGLGDYDSAVNYCLLGGSGIFHPTLGVERSRAVPSHDDQARLFGYLLLEFLQIEDPSHRVEQTGRLLERFGRWYDTGQVLELIPEGWSLDLVSDFFVGALRRMQAERSETTVVKALRGAENLQVQVRLADRCQELGPALEAAE